MSTFIPGLGDVFVEITANTGALRQQMDAAEQIVRRSTDRMSRFTAFGPLGSRLLRGGGALAGISALPSAISAQETNFQLLNAMVLAIQGRSRESLNLIGDVSASFYKAVQQFPIIGGFIDEALNALIQSKTPIGLLLQQIGRAREPITPPTPSAVFTAPTAGGVATVAPNFVLVRDVMQRQTGRLETMTQLLQSIDRHIEGWTLINVQ